MRKDDLNFDEVFGRKKSFTKNEFSDHLLNKIHVNAKREADLFDSFWNYFKDSYTNELDFQLFEEVYLYNSIFYLS